MPRYFSSSRMVGCVASARPGNTGSGASTTWIEHCPPSFLPSMTAAVHPAMPPPTMAIRLILRSGSIVPQPIRLERRRGYPRDRKPVNEASNFRRREHRLSALKNRSFSMSPSMSHVRKNGAALMVLAPFLLMLGCKDAAKEEPAAVAKAEDPAAVHPEIWPSPKWPFAKDDALEEKIAALLKKMTVEEKVGQVIQGDICCIKPEDMKQYHLGSILAGGGSAPGGNERAPAAEWLKLADEFYDASVDTSNGGAGIPMIWGIDAMHGHSNIVGGVLFPHNVGLGATHNPKLLGEIARVTAEQVRTTGIEWTFAPTVTVPQDDRWGRAYEGYSEDPGIVASYAGVFVKGLQGDPASPDFLKGHYVISSTKHFLADGGTEHGRDQGDSKASETELRDIH